MFDRSWWFSSIKFRHWWVNFEQLKIFKDHLYWLMQKKRIQGQEYVWESTTRILFFYLHLLMTKNRKRIQLTSVQMTFVKMLSGYRRINTVYFLSNHSFFFVLSTHHTHIRRIWRRLGLPQSRYASIRQIKEEEQEQEDLDRLVFFS